jgi:hypothetical protein
MRSKLVPVVLALGVCAAVALPGAAGARAPADTTVTIKEEASGDFYGYVKSPKPLKCADDRQIALFRVRQGKDERVATDNASLSGNRYRWSTGNTGLSGRFYARASRIAGCRADTSPTIRSSQ